MKRGRTGLLLTLFTVFAAGPEPVGAQAESIVERFTEPFVFDSVNPCNGEPVLISGELKITTRTTVDGGGTVHIAYNLVPSQVRGEGASGVAYKAVGGQREHINAGEGEQVIDTFTDTFNLISSGGTENFRARTVFHVTVTADGTVRTLFERGGEECRG